MHGPIYPSKCLLLYTILVFTFIESDISYATKNNYLVWQPIVDVP